MHKRRSLENVCYKENIFKFADINVYLTNKFMYHNGDVPDVFQKWMYLTLKTQQGALEARAHIFLMRTHISLMFYTLWDM